MVNIEAKVRLLPGFGEFEDQGLGTAINQLIDEAHIKPGAYRDKQQQVAHYRQRAQVKTVLYAYPNGNYAVSNKRGAQSSLQNKPGAKLLAFLVRCTAVK